MVKKGRSVLAMVMCISGFCIILIHTRISHEKGATRSKQQREMDEMRYRALGPLVGDDVRLVSHVKDFYLTPPSKKPYNLTRGVPATYKSQSKAGTWRFIHFYLQVLFPSEKPGFFIEAGALDGEFLSNTLWLEQTLGWTGLLVEPDEESFRHLQSKHRRAWTSNTCLSKDPFPKQTVHVSWHVRDIESGPWMHHANAHELGVTKRVQNDQFSLQSDRSYSVVQCFPLITFLKALNVSIVDFLSLDLEGSEKEILKNFFWDEVKIRILVVEIVSDILDEDIVNFMENKGYVLINRDSAPILYDYLFVRKDEKEFLKKLERYAVSLGEKGLSYPIVRHDRR